MKIKKKGHNCQLCKNEFCGRCFCVKYYGMDVSVENTPVCEQYHFNGTPERLKEIIEMEKESTARKILKGVKQLSDGWMKKYIFQYQLEDGSLYDYEVVSRNQITNKDHLSNDSNAVVIIPITTDGRYVLSREFRYTVNDYVWEFPAGLIDSGESPEEAARRELKEETGLDVDEIIDVLPGGYSSAGMTDEKVSVILCRVSGSIQNSKGKEEITSEYFSKNTIRRIIENENQKVSGRCQLFFLGLRL